MKAITLIIIMSSTLLFSQGTATKSLEELKYEMKNIIRIDDEVIKEEYNNKKKNRGLAIIYSALLPGMGELYAEGYSSGKFFTIADALLWGGLLGVTAYANNQEDNYRSFAETYGGVSLSGKDDKYFANIGNYLDIYQYNHLKELDRNFNDVYNEQTHYWKWNGQAERKEYRKIWKSSETASNTTRFIVGALILNRVASVVNAIRLVNAHNNNLKKELGWDMSFNYSNTVIEPDKISMNFRTSF
ncbi:MAG: hypothetical protein L3J41_04090 [Melioribacteraceae bacterium]|nr:hypothetical protein [Melioribacteraceae bacterium]